MQTASVMARIGGKALEGESMLRPRRKHSERGETKGRVAATARKIHSAAALWSGIPELSEPDRRNGAEPPVTRNEKRERKRHRARFPLVPDRSLGNPRLYHSRFSHLPPIDSISNRPLFTGADLGSFAHTHIHAHTRARARTYFDVLRMN